MAEYKVELINPSSHLKEEYRSFYEEWEASSERMIPSVIERDPSRFEEMLQFLQDNEKGIRIPAGWVPDSTYWLIDERKRVLGVVNIRHALTPFVRNSGGHIGYGIRPSE